eukprot:jgi/Botrbrau1/5099/Bobra.0128s0010.1
MLGNQEDALQDLDHADRLDSKNAFTLKYRGATKWALCRNQEALQDLNQADRLAPNDAFTLFCRGAILKGLGRDEEALQDLTRADKNPVQDAHTLAIRAGVKLQFGHLQKARNDAMEALRYCTCSGTCMRIQTYASACYTEYKWWSAIRGSLAGWKVVPKSQPLHPFRGSRG